MAVITKTLLVAHVADWAVHSRHWTVVVSEIERMVIAFIDNGLGIGFVTFCTHLISRHLFGVFQRNGIPCGHGGTGKNNEKTATENQIK